MESKIAELIETEGSMTVTEVTRFMGMQMIIKGYKTSVRQEKYV